MKQGARPLTKGTHYRTLNTPIKEETMHTLTASQARSNLYRIIDEAATSHEPIVITGKRNNAVLISAEDWAAIQETMYLLSVPGMRESILEGLQTPVDECAKELDW
jgi:prevent-host-death family protein